MNTFAPDRSDSEPRLAIEPVDSARFEAVARLSMLDAMSGMAFAAQTPTSHSIIIDTGSEWGRFVWS